MNDTKEDCISSIKKNCTLNDINFVDNENGNDSNAAIISHQDANVLMHSKQFHFM